MDLLWYKEVIMKRQIDIDEDDITVEFISDGILAITATKSPKTDKSKQGMAGAEELISVLNLNGTQITERIQIRNNLSSESIRREKKNYIATFRNSEHKSVKILL